MSFLLRHKFWLIAVLIVVAGIFATRMRRAPEPSVTEAPASSKREKGATAGAVDASGTSQIASEPLVPLAPIVQHDAANEMSKMLTDPNRSEEERVQAVREVLYLYRQGFGGDNPPGHNEIITSALIGENEKRTALLPKDSPAIRNGALVDPWGSPYWFHAISSKNMEVRSPGPDKELFTDDDVLVE